MPPSWLRSLAEHHSRIPPELETADWSRGLASSSDAKTPFSEGLLSASNIALQGEICALAVEPVLGYIAVGTTKGGVHLYGKPSVQISWTLRPANKVRHLLFKSGSPLLIAIDDKDNLSIFDLSRNDPQTKAKMSAAGNHFIPAQSTSTGSGPSDPTHPDTPMRIAAHSARNSVTCVEVSPLHNHLFMGLRDGTIDTFDLERLSPSPYRVPNLWWEEEEILRKSGVPDAPNRRHVPLIIDIKTHPKDLNQLLLAYEGGVILLDARSRTVLKTYQLRHLPGAVGSGVGNPDLIWTERASPATCIAWRPDGLAFACGHEDGCISLWDVDDDSKPITVRTLEFIDVDKPGGIPGDIPGGPAQTREPIFKLAWSGFPEQSWLNKAAYVTNASSVPAQEATSGTILTVLGGATERHPPGLVCLHMPPFTWSYASYWNSKSPEASSKARAALLSSLQTVAETRYAARSTVEDFLLIPRDSPYYSLAYDPTAVLILESADPSLPPLPPPASARGLAAYAFPPASTSGPAAAVLHTPGRQASFSQHKLNLPLPLSTSGSSAVLGAKLVEVSLHAYRTLAGRRDVSGAKGAASAAMEPLSSPDIDEDLALHGGLATASVVGASLGAEKEEVLRTMAKGEKHRILITWHLDGTVRFHDASPQLLLTPGEEQQEASQSVSSPGSSQSKRRSGMGGLPALTGSSDTHSKYLEKGLPNPLPHLTISVASLLQSKGMRGHPVFERLLGDTKRFQIVKVDFAAEALEAAIVLRSGQVLIYKFGYARYSETEAFREEVADDVHRDEEMAADLASQQMGNVSPSFHSHLGPQSPPPMLKLDGAMAGAMQELDVSGSPTSPPPRPKRDPKRASAAQRLASKVRGDQVTEHLSPSGHSRAPPAHQLPVEEITLLGHLATWDSDGFKPNILVELQRGEVTALSMSDVGFLAIACGLALAVVDMRGPELIIREGFGDSMPELSRAGSRDRKDEKRIVEEENKSSIALLYFSICRTADQPALSPTLVTVRDNGFVSLWTFTKSSLDLWMCERSHGSRIDDLARPLHVSVVDMAGNVCYASPAELQRSLREQSRGPGEYGAAHAADINLLLSVARRTIALRVGLTGARLSKVEVEEDLMGVCILNRHDEKACLALSATSIRLYSLPQLQLITRLPRHNRNREERLSLSQVGLSFDGGGDFVEVVNSLDVRLWTVFATIPRAGPPSLLLYQPPSMPMAPNAINNAASSVVSWIGGKSSALTSGAQFDEVLAGANRPPLPKLPEPKFVEVRLQEQLSRDKAAAAEDSRSSTPMQSGNSRIGEGIFAKKKEERKQAVRDTQEASTQAAWNIDLAKQRGEMMNSLEEGLSSLEKGAKGWMQSAREDLIKQAAKDKLTKFF